MAVAPVFALNPLFDEILDFLASGHTPQEIIAFKPSEALDQRLHDLLDRNASDRLTAEERAELDEFLRVNQFMNILKIRARQKLALG
ncbi:MAG: hypothetical protein DWB42_01060 [Chloroflexi bacterium]|nr:hypothetical protein [Chloroflexota bacterium]MDL1885118.1 hypothetical protein [Anaerolineae bacterium CFX8]NWG18000.1 hypothetical protein [Chloroflexota bacterium]